MQEKSFRGQGIGVLLQIISVLLSIVDRHESSWQTWHGENEQQWWINDFGEPRKWKRPWSRIGPGIGLTGRTWPVGLTLGL